jgi:hypothetical protein
VEIECEPWNARSQQVRLSKKKEVSLGSECRLRRSDARKRNFAVRAPARVHLSHLTDARTRHSAADDGMDKFFFDRTHIPRRSWRAQRCFYLFIVAPRCNPQAPRKDKPPHGRAAIGWHVPSGTRGGGVSRASRYVSSGRRDGRAVHAAFPPCRAMVKCLLTHFKCP